MWMRLKQWAPRVADSIGGIYINGKKPVVDVEDGIDNTTSGPAVVFTVDPHASGQGGFHDRPAHHGGARRWWMASRRPLR